MTAPLSARALRLADALADLKAKVRAALATELAGAVGDAVRDVLVAALLDRLASPPRAASLSPPRRSWREAGDGHERYPWGEPAGPWADDTDADPRVLAGGERDEADGRVGATPPVAPAAAVAVGVSAGRWWLARGGTPGTAVGLGLLASALGLAGGPFARAALAVLAAATDVLTAESALARRDPS